MDQDDVEEPVEDCLLTGCRGRELPGEQADGIVQWVVIGVSQMEHGWERFDQLATDVPGELVRTAEEYGRFRITGVRIFGVLSSKVIRTQAQGRGAVGDAVVGTTPNERDVTGSENESRLWVVEP